MELGGVDVRQCLAIIPGHPLFGAVGQCSTVFLQRGQVIERIGAHEPTGMDQAHERVADVGALCGLVEERIFAVKNGLFQRPLAHVMLTVGLCRVGRACR